MKSEEPLLDKYHRPINDLRISVIDRCNMRCTYCMPKEKYPESYSFLRQEQWLTHGEIIRLARLFVQCGTHKIRITGGEPLLRPNLHHIIADLSKIKGINDIAITTNGILFPKYAKDLQKSGLQRITISLDSLDQNIFSNITGLNHSVDQVLQSIDVAQTLNFKVIKVNVMVHKNINYENILDMIKYFRGTSVILRFIEFMDVGNRNAWSIDQVVPSNTLLKKINDVYPLEPVDHNYFGEVANRYKFVDGKGEIGFISSVSQPFCQSCTRARLSTDGKIYTCLFAQHGIDIMNPMRRGSSDSELLELIKNTWQNRSDQYSIDRIKQPLENSSHDKKIEMFQIGG